MLKSYKILVFFSVLILMSCQYDPYAHKYTTTKPNESEIIGNYIFESQTVDYRITEFKDAKNQQTVIPKIEIKNDGTFQVENLPVFETFDANFTKLISKTGEWKILTIGTIADGKGNRKEHWGIHLTGLPNELKYAGLMNKKNPYKIIFGFGDPDSGRVLIFKSNN